MSALAPSSGMALARSFTAGVLEQLAELVTLAHRTLELQQSNGLNYLAAGTVTGGGSLTSNIPVQLIAANPHRRGLSIQNLPSSTDNITLGLGQTQPQALTGIVLAPGASWDGRISGALWRGSVSVISPTTGTAYSWLQASGPTERQEAIS